MPSVSPAAFADTARYFDDWISFRRRVDRVPGVQVAMLYDDQLVLSSAHGLADVEAGTPLTTRHLFRIASHSKVFTATAIMQLVEQGRLRLDDEAGNWLDFLDGSPVAGVTIREMLSHSAGVVRDGWDGDFWQLFRPFPDADELRRISLDAADVLSRNERFKYSNISFSLLGLVVEAVTGRLYADYVTEHVVGRLELNDTGPDLDTARAHEYAIAYSALSYAERRLPIDPIATGAMASATGFYSTASDVVRFAAAHFHGDTRLLSDDSKRLMQRTEWKVEGSANQSYGLGLAIADIKGRRLLGHGGGFPGNITYTLFDPVDWLAVSVMTNAIDGPAQVMATTAFRLLELAERGDARQTGGEPERVSGIDSTAFVGRYANLWTVFDIVELGGQLYQLDVVAADPTADPQRLDIVDAHTLRIADAPGYASPGERLVFDRNDDGSVRSVRGGSATTSFPLDRLAAAVAARERITLGSPLVPSRRP